MKITVKCYDELKVEDMLELSVSGRVLVVEWFNGTPYKITYV